MAQERLEGPAGLHAARGPDRNLRDNPPRPPRTLAGRGRGRPARRRHEARAHERHAAAGGLARRPHARRRAARGPLRSRLLPRQAEERVRRRRRPVHARPRLPLAPRELPAGTKIKEVTFDADCSGGDPDAAVPPSSCGPEPTRTIEFNSNGTVRTLRPGTSGTVRVSSDDGSPSCGLVFQAATARIRVGPIVYG